MNNRKWNVKNHCQGKWKKVLCVCSTGLLRSPTAAEVLSQKPFNFNTRSCGMFADYALIILDDVLLSWADEIVCMTNSQKLEIEKKTWAKPVINLEIEDNYDYRDPELIRIIKTNYREKSK